MSLEMPTDAMTSLFGKPNLEDSWVAPRTWETLSSQIGGSAHPSPLPSDDLYTPSAVSEPSLVRLAMNALQGVESALTSVEKLSLLFSCSSADRTSHRIPSLWTWCSSTSAVGNLLTSIGQFGCIVFLLHLFSNFFTSTDLDKLGDYEENKNCDSCEEGKWPHHRHTLVNQAFAVSVRKVLDGYISALNTLSASISLRHLPKMNDEGCLTTIGHPNITLLEIFLHTTELRTQIEALGNICNIDHLTTGFPISSVEDIKKRSYYELRTFPRGADLLSFLYSLLKVADPDHCSLLKFLFLQSYEPYCGFIRSWIYDGSISDPYAEFVVEYENEVSIYTSKDARICSPLPNIRERHGVSVPCFLNECLTPLLRSGQQLQVISKLLEQCNCINTYEFHEEILPRMIDLSSKYSWLAFPLTFNKETIETTTLERTTYYQKMLEKIDVKLIKFEFSSQQATTRGVSLKGLNIIGKNHTNRSSYVAIDKIVTASGGRNGNMAVGCEVSSTMDEYSHSEDILESSECSTSEDSDSEGKIESEQMLYEARSNGSRFLEALDLSSNCKISDVYRSDSPCTVEEIPHKINEKSGYSSHHFQEEAYHLATEPKFSKTPETEFSTSAHGVWLFDGLHVEQTGDENAWLMSCNRDLDLSMRTFECRNTVSCLNENISQINAGNKYLHPHETCESSHMFKLQQWKPKYDSVFFSMNPAKNKHSFFNVRPISEGRDSANYGYPFFDFTSVKYLLKEYTDKLSCPIGPEIEKNPSIVPEALDTHVSKKNDHNVDGHYIRNLRNHDNSSGACSSLPKAERDYVTSTSGADAGAGAGAGAWESLLGESHKIDNSFHRDQKARLVAAVEMPLDFVVKKCLLDEILLQYQYLSKLTIKLLVEGFKLQEHLMSLRRYHFMELADWADMFIMSLSQRKWLINEEDKRIPEIQGLLEFSVQRSSCEGDPNKHRLFVYIKKDIIHLSAPISGIHSFDYLGLGYRVDWPVSIILTPSALKIYSEIFNFLIQLKLAVFSLGDAWILLKSYHEEHHKGELNCISALIETRHNISHFVSTLQQYVQSQLSQVSWCRFLHSLKHKVEDMLDLETVHMLYLTESLHMCFLSNEARPIAGIIEKILQCALDFRSCFTGRIWPSGTNNGKPSHGFSEINIVQVHSIGRSFTKNLEELHLIYQQSPNNGEFGISHFWDYLNYNEYYTEAIHKQRSHSIP